jgi:hypothetical protein
VQDIWDCAPAATFFSGITPEIFRVILNFLSQVFPQTFSSTPLFGLLFDYERI